MKVAVYIRFGNRPETISFEKALAERRLREYAEQHNYQICDEVVEFASAQGGLPKLKQLLNRSPTDVPGILCLSPATVCRHPMMMPLLEHRARKHNKHFYFAERP